MSALRLRPALSLAALALATTLAGCAEPPGPPPSPKVAPPVALSSRLIEQASSYRAYMTRSTAISPAFADGAAVANALVTGASYDPQAIVRGAIAYGAVVALQDPEFVASVRAFAFDPAQRQTVTYAILRDPAYAAGFPGAANAAGAIIAALGDDGRRLYDQGKVVKQAAYDVQASAWSKADVPNRPGRLQNARVVAAAGLAGDMAETARLQQAAMGALPRATVATPAEPPYTTLVVRALAVAALAALGQAGDENLAMVTPVLADTAAASCFNMSKLNLYQCLAVSKPHYEDVFCLGQHVMIDTGRCTMKFAGAVMPIEIKPPPLAVTYRPVVKAKPPAKKKR